MADYLPSEIVDMILILGGSHVNYAAASRLYAERFLDRRHPTYLTISTLNERAQNRILFRERRHHEYNENDAPAVTVIAAVHVDPQFSTREIEREIGIPQSTVSRILRSLNYHAYHITLTLALRPHHILDSTSPDIFLWDYIKNVVFAQRPTTREGLMERIRRACAVISRKTLLKTVNGFERRLRLCLQANGEHFEQLLRG